MSQLAARDDTSYRVAFDGLPDATLPALADLRDREYRLKTALAELGG